jgi:predicted amidophosphoribosyltransferase
MSKAFAHDRKHTLGSDDATAVLSLELEKDRARRRGFDLARRLLGELERKLLQPQKQRTKRARK